MLVLSRFISEEIVISKDGVEIIRVMVVDVKGDKVRIGIGADRQFQIDRAEVFTDKKENPR